MFRILSRWRMYVLLQELKNDFAMYVEQARSCEGVTASRELGALVWQVTVNGRRNSVSALSTMMSVEHLKGFSFRDPRIVTFIFVAHVDSTLHHRHHAW
jgi:hypothetical protein